ncbi:MAG: alcohol dehydrogenase catalytic domain-containing protein [Actinomycetota bacterium]
MKALVYLGPRRMELQDVAEAQIGAEDALVRVRASAICGSDLHGFREASPRRIPPLVMGHEAAGVVEAVGANADPSLVGTRVVAMPVVPCGSCARCREGRPNLCPDRQLMGMHFPGAFAEAFVLPAGQLLPIPDGLEDAEASLAEPLANGIHTASRSVSAGDSVLVIGAGAIGLFAALAAVLAGASRVMVSDRLPGRLALVTGLGGEPVEAEEAANAVAERTSGEGVDVVIDAVGLPSTWALALEAVRYGGHVEAIGLGTPQGPLDYHVLVSKGVTLVGAYACVPADFERSLALLAAGTIDVAPWITTIPLADGQRAFESLVDEDRYNKVVLTP